MVKREVRAICRFWVFDGNGLLGHQLIDSRWFEKNPPTESGWKRRSKNRRSTGISRGNDRDVMSALDFALIFAPLIHIHFCVWLGRFVDRWWNEVWYAVDFFLSNHCTFVTLAARKWKRRLEWTNSPWHASQKTWCWPTCEKPRARTASYGPAFPVIFPFTLPDSSVPEWHRNRSLATSDGQADSSDSEVFMFDYALLIISRSLWIPFALGTSWQQLQSTSRPIVPQRTATPP